MDIVNLQISHVDNVLEPDPAKVVIRPFDLSWDASNGQSSRTERLLGHILTLNQKQVATELQRVHRDFANRHTHVSDIFANRYADIAAHTDLVSDDIDKATAELIGAYFCQEYSYSSAALMNPSVTLHPDQSGLGIAEQRIIISLRAVGEGHISSVTFREGILQACGRLILKPDPDISTAANIAPDTVRPAAGPVTVYSYPGSSPSETVLFPITDAQHNGLEDLRLTRIVDENGAFEWIGTYTAYNGKEIQSELLRTRDFRRFDLQPMRGSAARNKGMALFPGKIDGQYAMVGRQDGESLCLFKSDDLGVWEDGQRIFGPKYPWEFVQMGNCGPPIELDEGWLILTHGVGAMRKYAIGAALLDKKDPSKVLGRTPKPILSADEEQRNGYVPNVVYSCGAMKCGDQLFLPYGVADSSIAFAFFNMSSIIESLV